jgi:hypothetical protein
VGDDEIYSFIPCFLQQVSKLCRSDKPPSTHTRILYVMSQMTHFSYITLLVYFCGGVQPRNLILFYGNVCVCDPDYVASIVGLLVNNEVEINWK